MKKVTNEESSMDTSDSTTAASSLISAGAPPPPPLAVGVKLDGKEDKMEIEGAKTEERGESKKVTLLGTAKGSGGETASGGGEKRKSNEPDFQMIANPARVLPQQVSQNQLL